MGVSFKCSLTNLYVDLSTWFDAEMLTRHHDCLFVCIVCIVGSF